MTLVTNAMVTATALIGEGRIGILGYVVLKLDSVIRYYLKIWLTSDLFVVVDSVYNR